MPHVIVNSTLGRCSPKRRASESPSKDTESRERRMCGAHACARTRGLLLFRTCAHYACMRRAWAFFSPYRIREKETSRLSSFSFLRMQLPHNEIIAEFLAQVRCLSISYRAKKEKMNKSKVLLHNGNYIAISVRQIFSSCIFFSEKKLKIYIAILLLYKTARLSDNYSSMIFFF